MQLELFPELVNDVNITVNVQENVEQRNFEVLLYANNTNDQRDLVIRTDTPEGNVIFSHVNPDQHINVFVDGNVEIRGNLSLTGTLSIAGQIVNIAEMSEKEMYASYNINNTCMVYDVKRNLIFIDDKEIKNYTELGKAITKALRKHQENLMFNDFKEFFNY